ncbi:2-hydroxyacid dehydrogenase [Oceanobacillus timonensis]|uniref:2-hydroxyacid dehydrogenase n=1 Tax=Oceanobacillus timonensis TaxID=1926285 RepID=UPI0009BC4238|nr:D-glycerate dehydrogenase [Oceanobacillus timonensis]
MKPKVYITRKLPESIINKIEEVCQVRMWKEENEPVPREVLLHEIEQADGLFCLLTEVIDREVLNAANKLKVIANMAVGYNNIDTEEAAKKDIIVTNTPDVLTETTADLTFALLMSTARRIVESSTYLKEGNWKTWSPMQLSGQDINGAKLGIIGMGRIGKALIERAKGFNMDVSYYNRSRKLDVEEAFNVTFLDKDSLLKESDFICILVPYSPEVHHFIGERELRLMKNSAILINTARGGIVDENALFHALKNEEIWGAGLDVFKEEPVSLENPLLSLPNVTALPHIGSSSEATRLEMADLTAENLIQVLVGKKAITPVNG